MNVVNNFGRNKASACFLRTDAGKGQAFCLVRGVFRFAAFEGNNLRKLHHKHH